ncbi:MAG: DUF2802 domain-containing protein, partial [Bdellovibrio sp.]
KVKDIQTKIQAADKQLAKIEQSMQKSLEVAKIFQDRIPHNEILERQNTIKYVKAARLAHQGLSAEEIAQQVDLSQGEIEFIAKVNRDQLMFCEDSLPEWVNEENLESSAQDLSDVDDISFMTPLQKDSKADLSTAFEIPRNDQEALKKLGDAFKAACQEVEGKEKSAEQTSQNISALFNVTQSMAQNFLSEKPTPKAPTALATKPKSSGTAPNIRPVEFRRIDMANDLG